MVAAASLASDSSAIIEEAIVGADVGNGVGKGVGCSDGSGVGAGMGASVDAGVVVHYCVVTQQRPQTNEETKFYARNAHARTEGGRGEGQLL